VNDRSDEERALFEALRLAPPLPPWAAFPEYDRDSMGWRMGAGEDHLYRLYVFFKHCDAEERAEYERRHPEPAEWLGWYAELDDA
jgi:hypothetical protein